MASASDHAPCETCQILREELSRCRTRLEEFEGWKKSYDEWRSSWQFRRGLLIGFLLISLVANVASLALR